MRIYFRRDILRRSRPVHAEFFRDMSAVHFDCLFSDPEFRTDLLVEQPCDEKPKNLELPRCKLIKPRSERVAFNALAVTISRPSKSMVDGTQQLFVIERLREKIHGSCFHRMDGHRDVEVAGNEHDLLVTLPASGRLLQIEAVNPWHPDVKYQARRTSVRLAREKICRRREDFDGIACGKQQSLKSPAHRWVIMHKEGQGARRGHVRDVLFDGSENWKHAASIFGVLGGEPPAVGLDDRSRNNQSHVKAVPFGREELLEDLVPLRR
jgi:hypothetical protein